MTRPCGQRCVTCTRFTGSDGSYSIAPARLGGIATITWRAAMASVSVRTTAPRSLHSILRTGWPSLIALPSLSATRRATVCVPPMTRSACAGPNSALRSSQARISQPRCSIEISSGLALGTEPTSVATSLRTLSFSTFWRSHSANVIESSRAASACVHGACAVDRHREIVHRFLGLGVEIAAGKARVGVVLDAVIFVGVEDAALQGRQARARRGIGLAAHLLDQRVEALLRGADPLAAEIHEGAVLHLDRPRAAADALARFQHHDVQSRLLQPIRGGEPGKARADDADIRALLARRGFRRADAGRDRAGDGARDDPAA